MLVGTYIFTKPWDFHISLFFIKENKIVVCGSVNQFKPSEASVCQQKNYSEETGSKVCSVKKLKSS